MSGGHILIVEDEVGIAESLAYLLGQEHYRVSHMANLAGARAVLAGEACDLVLLDLGLPDGNGIELLRELRSGAAAGLPVIVLTSRDTEVDRVVGLELGADDYVTKPFSAREVVARVKAVLRRTGDSGGNAAPATALAAPATGLVVDLGRRRAAYDGTELHLTKTELDLLAVLAGRPGQVFERATLLDRVWGDDVVVADRTVDAHVKSLRHKLREAGADTDLIETVRGVGYRMRE